MGTSNSLMSLGLSWAANGTLTSQTVTRPSLSATQSYAYDGVNRLSTASESNSAAQSWSQTYVYDNVGNRGVMGSVVNSSYTPAAASATSIPFNSSNQWTGVDNPASYDAAGNTTRVRTETMGYDAESRMTSWTDSAVSGSTVTLTYDGDGRRITKTSNLLGTTTYVYDPAGNLAVEVGGGSAIGASTAYLTTDHLGSVRLVTSGPSGACLGAHDYLPFGEEIPGSWGRGAVPCYPAADTTWKFGGQERDAENGIDNFLARHLGSSMGRFFSVDPGNAGANPGDPQSWNGYTYASNNPLVNTDPTGTTVCDSNGANCHDEVTVVEGGPDPLALLSVQLLFASARLAQQAQQTAYNLTDQFVKYITAPRDQNCVAAAAAAGAVLGAGAGGYVGATALGSAGAVGGTLVAPGVGTVALGAGGAAAGGVGGAIVGGWAGAAIGGGIGWLACSSSLGPTGGGGPRRVTNPKHHPNSASPEPKNAQELFEKSVVDGKGVRWAKDVDGTIHRFSAPSNGESYWNGSTVVQTPSP